VPKMKTHKSAAKRFKRRNSGSIARGRTPRAHKLTKKTGKQKRQMRAAGGVHEADRSRVGRMLGCRV